VRRVLERLRSDFCWARMQDTFRDYQEYGATEVWPYTCKMYNDWIAAALAKYQDDPFFAWCHMVPQWCYASKVDDAVPHTTGLQSSLRLLHPSLAPISLGHVHDNVLGPRNRFNITNACLNSSNYRALKLHFAYDFEHVEGLIDGASGTTGAEHWRLPHNLVLVPLAGSQ